MTVVAQSMPHRLHGEIGTEAARDGSRGGQSSLESLPSTERTPQCWEDALTAPKPCNERSKSHSFSKAGAGALHGSFLSVSRPMLAAAASNGLLRQGPARATVGCGSRWLESPVIGQLTWS